MEAIGSIIAAGQEAKKEILGETMTPEASYMKTTPRIILTVRDRDAFWEIEVERNGAWHSTIYAGSSPTVDDAFVAAKRYLLAINCAANGPIRYEDGALPTRP